MTRFLTHVGTAATIALLIGGGLSAQSARAQTMGQSAPSAEQGTPSGATSTGDQTAQPYDSPTKTNPPVGGGGSGGGASGGGGGAGAGGGGAGGGDAGGGGSGG